MILKNINKLIIFLLIFNYSCSSFDNFKNKKDSINLITVDIYDKNNYISEYKNLLHKADYVFLGAWNFKEEIFKKEKNFIKKGGKFITHVPVPKII